MQKQIVTNGTIFVVVAMTISGCAAFRQSTTDVDVNNSKAMDAKYDYSDMRGMTDEVATQILAHPFLAGKAPTPVLVVLGVENRTKDYLDTKALTDTLRTKLLSSGKAMFVNAARRDTLLAEQNYQAEHATAASRAAIGKQLGARYMLTGSIVDLTKKSGREVRVSKKEEVYYLLTIEVTDLTTGLIVASSQVERARKTSKPIIGW